MKLACKILIIISMAVGFWFIAPVVVGIVALSKLDQAKTKDELTGVAICTLLLCNTIAGILMLCITDEELQKDGSAAVANKTEQINKQPSAQSEQNKTDEVIKKIEKLKSLKDQGILSEEEFENLRKREINKILGE